MEEDKRKKIEARLRQMIAAEKSSSEESRPAEVKSYNVTVIRRRKGNPDTQIE